MAHAGGRMVVGGYVAQERPAQKRHNVAGTTSDRSAGTQPDQVHSWSFGLHQGREFADTGGGGAGSKPHPCVVTGPGEHLDSKQM